MDKHFDVKIAVVYHSEAMIVSDGVYAPVLAGAAVTATPSKDGKVFLGDEFLSRMRFRDDGGENISSRNRSLNEMSAVYWIWKNYAKFGDPAFVGLAHYRRLPITDESASLPRRRWFPGSEMYVYGDEALFRAATDSSKVHDMVERNPCWCAYRYAASLGKGGENVRSCRDRFVALMGEEKGFLYDEMERLVVAALPEAEPEIAYMRTHSDYHLCNMFILPKERFFEYCQFAFPILFRLDELNAGETDVNRARAPGFLSEFLTSVYFSVLARRGEAPGLFKVACWRLSSMPGWIRAIVRTVLSDGMRHCIKRLLGR